MQIRIRHQTDYHYSEPFINGIQYVRLNPRSGPSQSVESWTVRAPGTLTQWTDHFGNICHTMAFLKPEEEVSIVVSGAVETFDTKGVLPINPVGLPAEAYLNPTSYTHDDPPLRGFARHFRREIAKDRLDGLHSLMLAVPDSVEYREGETHVHTTAAEAMKDGFGVCQDHAHIFIAVCKALGVPARYISGYLWTGQGSEAHSASHAWAEALVPDLGWVSFDPANGVSATDHYVRIAVGFDYAGAGPVRGVRRGGGLESMAVAIELQGQQ
ncbi:MAG: transglutaminase family protein [Alphaproteobacteria bacterium]|nr:transglutaminase family protein [Alphaproteobacteria bacterium]